MLSINPISLSYVMDAMQQDRLRELEQRQLAKEARASLRPAYAPLLVRLGRGLVALGSRLEAQGEPERRQTPTSA